MLFTYLTEMLRIQTRKSITRGGGPVITCLFNKNCEEMNVIYMNDVDMLCEDESK